MDVPHPVDERACLLAHRRDDRRMPVAGRRDPECRSEVDVSVAVGIPDVGPEGSLPEDREVSGKQRDVGRFHSGQTLGQGRGENARYGTGQLGRLRAALHRGAVYQL